MGGGNVSQDQTSIICIDLKSFYASVECVERGLDPFKANLVVADPTRSKSTICLAITPAMKSLGIKNRCRIHEIPDCVKYITAMPRMQLYMDYSAKIYGIYLRYVSKEDIHVYSVDECFIDVTNYLQLYHLTAKEMAVKSWKNPLIGQYHTLSGTVEFFDPSVHLRIDDTEIQIQDICDLTGDVFETIEISC